MEHAVIKTWQRWLKACGDIVLGAGMSALVGLACMQVVLRYFFDSAVPWMEEISVLILVAMVWLSVIPLWVMRSHIALDIFIMRMPPAWRAAVELSVNLALVLLAAGLGRASWETYIGVDGLEMGASELPMAALYYPVTAGAVGLAIAGLHGAWRVIRERRQPR